MNYWISNASLPDQNWAILEENDNKTIVHYSDKNIEYSSREEAIRELQEDEYSPFDSLTKEDENDLEVPISMLCPPKEGESLYVKATEEFIIEAFEKIYGNADDICIYKGCNKKALMGKAVCALHYSKNASNKNNRGQTTV